MTTPTLLQQLQANGGNVPAPAPVPGITAPAPQPQPGPTSATGANPTQPTALETMVATNPPDGLQTQQIQTILQNGPAPTPTPAPGTHTPVPVSVQAPAPAAVIDTTATETKPAKAAKSGPTKADKVKLLIGCATGGINTDQIGTYFRLLEEVTK